jgi:hypothetical protein
MKVNAIHGRVYDRKNERELNGHIDSKYTMVPLIHAVIIANRCCHFETEAFRCPSVQLLGSL